MNIDLRMQFLNIFKNKNFEKNLQENLENDLKIQKQYSKKIKSEIEEKKSDHKNLNNSININVSIPNNEEIKKNYFSFENIRDSKNTNTLKSENNQDLKK